MIIIAKIQNKIANIYINGEIGWEANANQIASEINYISDNHLADEIHIKINSEGGSVIDGVRIVSAILNSKIPVKTHNEGFALSMGAVIWLAAKKENRFMSNFAVNMFHAPYFPGFLESDLDDDMKNFLNKTYNQLSTILQNQTGKSKEDIDLLFSKDSFFDASESIDYGLLPDENIIKYASTPELDNSLSISDKIKKVAAFYNEINNNPYNTLDKNDNTSNTDINNNKKANNMNILAKINQMLGLRDEASEIVTVEAVTQLQTEKDQLKNEIVNLKKDYKLSNDSLKDAENKVRELETKITEFEAEKEAAKVENAVSAVKAAIEAGKFSKDKEAELTVIAKANIETFTTMVDAVSVKAPDIAGSLDNEINIEDMGVAKEDFNYETLEAKHPDVLSKIEAANPKLYNQLVDAYVQKYSKEKSK